MAAPIRDRLFAALAREASFAPFATSLSDAGSAVGGASGALLAANAERVPCVGALFYGDGAALLARGTVAKDLLGWANGISVPLPPSVPRPGDIRLVREAQAWLDAVGLGADFERPTGVADLRLRHVLRPPSGTPTRDRDAAWAWLARQIARRARRETEIADLLALPVRQEVAAVRERWCAVRARLPAGVASAPEAPPVATPFGKFEARFAGLARHGRKAGPVSLGTDGAFAADWRAGTPHRETVDWALAALAGLFGPEPIEALGRAPWMGALDGIRPSKVLSFVSSVPGPTRLRWRVSVHPHGASIAPIGFDGDREIPLPDGSPIDRLSALDRALIRVFQAERWHGGGHLFEALCAGDLDAVDARGNPIRAVRSRPVLRVGTTGAGDATRLTGTLVVARRELALDEAPFQLGRSNRAVDLADGELRVVDTTGLRNDVLATIRQAFDVGIPVAAAPRLLERLATALPDVEIEASPELYGDAVAADPTPVVEVTTRGGIAARVTVVPLPGGEPHEPGAGSARVFGGGRHAVRDLDAERARAAPVAERLGLPRALGAPGEISALLAGVRSLGDAVRLVWDGGARKVVRRLTGKDVRMSLRSVLSWLEIGGNAEVDGALVAVQQLLAAAASGATHLVVGDHLFELEDQLAGQLAELARQADGTRLPALSSLDELAALAESGVALDAPADWSRLRARQLAAAATAWPVPDGLRATLRDYQSAGFAWLAGLASWAPGALLCDDMGLGKTVQTLALLLHRQSEGPALVVAPTSVVFNWQREATRFAPALAVRAYHGAARELSGVGAGAVVLTSWDLLVRDVDALAGMRFATVVFDEAQAAKNPHSKRSQAARRLDAGFRVTLSGTPIENRLSDLWSLAAFGVPGLFGPWEFFRERFAVPVERDRDPVARGDLARVLSPFLLRRRKEEVARDLPPREEVVERVTLTASERDVYDRERIRALSQLSGPLPPNQRRFQALAALTRLRQLACHPDPGGTSNATSTKIERLVERIDELRSEGRATLVFSSFVRLLDRAEAALAAAGARCLRLDGATPLPARRERVDAFQAGSADVFLISLKAGGTGLNLTAADTVFHLDPWWNPAAEAQAADRAHRIGQDKPVTVYRLVAEGTVEEAILTMQADKRALVSAVLDDEAAGTAISLDDVTAILAFGGSREAAPPPPPAPPPRDYDADRFRAWLSGQGIAPSSGKVYAQYATRFVNFLEDVGIAVPPPDPAGAIASWCREEGVASSGPAVSAARQLLRHLGA